MKNQKSPEVTKQIAKDFAYLKKAVKELFDEDLCTFDKKDNMIIFPAGFIALNENKKNVEWGLSIDHFWIDSPEEDEENTYYGHQMIFYFISDISKKVNVHAYEGLYTVFNDDGICVGSIFGSEIEKYMEENEVDFSIAKNVLSNKLIVKFEEQEEEEKEQENKVEK